MTMTLEEAFAFRLPNGKTLMEASWEDWKRFEESMDSELERAKLLNPATMTEEDRRHHQATADRRRDFNEAAAVIKEHLKKRGRPA